MMHHKVEFLARTLCGNTFYLKDHRKIQILIGVLSSIGIKTFYWAKKLVGTTKGSQSVFKTKPVNLSSIVPREIEVNV